MLNDVSEQQTISRDVARMERKGVSVVAIEHAGIVREALVWGWGKTPGALVVTTWIAHLGGPLAGGSISYKQKVWDFGTSADPRDADHPPRRWSVEILPDSFETFKKIKAMKADQEDDVA